MSNVQVDDQGEEEEAVEEPPPPATDQPKKDIKPEKKKSKNKRIDSAAYSMAVPEKFKGYEVFYDAPDDPEIPVAHGEYSKYLWVGVFVWE